MKVVATTDGPCLCLFATRTIQPDEEILYDYGITLSWKMAWNSANRTLGTIDKTIVNNNNSKTVLKLYQSSVRPNWNTVYKHGGYRPIRESAEKSKLDDD